jgi:type VI secretion system protein
MNNAPLRRDRLRALPAAVAILIAVSAACSTGAKVRSMFGGLLPMQVSVAPALNENAPVAVDLVVVYDAKVLDALLKLPAAEWFTKKQQLVKDYPNGLDVQKSWEWTPGQEIPKQTITYHAGAKKVVLFADYQTDGEHRVTVDPQQPFRLVLGEGDLTVEAPQ